MEIIGRKKICLAYFRSRNVEYKQKKIRRKNSKLINSGTLEKNSKIKYFDSTKNFMAEDNAEKAK